MHCSDKKGRRNTCWTRVVLKGTCLAIVILTVVCNVVVGCSSLNKKEERKVKATVNHDCYPMHLALTSRLEAITDMTISAIRRTNEYPPTSDPEFTRWWMARYTEAEMRRFGSGLDRKRGCFIDVWGEPICLIVDRNCLVGFGSKGPNKKWEDTEGDDMCCFLKEKGLEPKPPLSQVRSESRKTFEEQGTGKASMIPGVTDEMESGKTELERTLNNIDRDRRERGPANSE